MYNYLDSMKEDILTAIRDNYTPEEIAEKMEDRDSFEQELNDDLWVDDSVTGNGSGSYTFSRCTAKEYVNSNMLLCCEAIHEFCVDAETVAGKFLSEDWEYFDVTIRCYLLGSAIWEALEELSEAA